MFRAVPLIIRSSKTVSSDSPTSAVAADRFDKYPMLHVQLTTIKNIVHVTSCWLCLRKLVHKSKRVSNLSPCSTRYIHELNLAYVLNKSNKFKVLSL